MYCQKTYKLVPSRRGVTLLELVMVIAIGSAIAVATAMFLITGSRMTAAVMTQNRMDVMARAAIERMKNEMREGKSFAVTNSGKRLEITNYDNSKTYYEYRDDDDDPDTQTDNALFRMEEGDTEGTRLLSFIDPSIGQPVFTHGGGDAPVTIRIRLGDPVGNQKAHESGSGTQAVDILTTVTARNS